MHLFDFSHDPEVGRIMSNLVIEPKVYPDEIEAIRMR